VTGFERGVRPIDEAGEGSQESGLVAVLRAIRLGLRDMCLHQEQEAGRETHHPLKEAARAKLRWLRRDTLHRK